MVNVSIARRYARALLDASGASADEALAQLQEFVTLVETSAELRDVVANPAYSRPQRAAVVEQLLKLTGATQPALIKLIMLMNERNRLSSLTDLARLYREMVDRRMGRVRGKISSATALSAEQLKKLEGALEKVTQRNVVLEAKVDPKLLGGLTAQVGSTIYDGSLRNQLDTLKQELST